MEPIRNSNEVKPREFIDSPNWEYSCTQEHLSGFCNLSTGFALGVLRYTCVVDPSPAVVFFCDRNQLQIPSLRGSIDSNTIEPPATVS